MKKKLLKIIVVVLGIFILIILGFNLYKVVKLFEYNNLITFANNNYPGISDNSNILFSVDLNPFKIIADTEIIKSRGETTKTEILNQYNVMVGLITAKEYEVGQILNQALKLKIDITDNFESSSQIFRQVSTFDESLFIAAKARFDYVNNYKENLKKIFSDFKDLKTKAGLFSNPLWGYSDIDLSALVNSMSDEDKAGQLLFFSFDGMSLDEQTISRYKALNPGGMIIMGKNVGYTKQVQALTRQIQNINPLIPMFIPTDQEGGAVKRIPWDTTAGQKSWAGINDQDLCNLGKQRSDLLLELGINMNFSPVVDLTNPRSAFINNRTISGDPQIVYSKSKIYITCGQEEGIIDTLKHFPGHGPTTLDSHYQLPFVSKSKTDWLLSDAIPFKNNLDAKQIMVGHLVYTQIDKDNPTSLSRIFITDILRNEWGYTGLIITDDMNMLHTSTGISLHDALLRTFNAGTDIAVYVGAPASFEDVKMQLVNLIKNGEISTERINDALFRILVAKRDMIY